MIPSPADIRAAVDRIRSALKHEIPIERIISSLAHARKALLWDERRPNRAIISEIAARSNFSEAVTAASLNLLPPSGIEELRSVAQKLRHKREIIGFIMPGNMPGGGLHELLLTLLAGRGAIVKAAQTEPLFFRRFGEKLHEIDPGLAARLAVFSWDRDAKLLTNSMLKECNRIVVFGDDETVESIRKLRATDAPVFGFGARVSACVITSAAIRNSNADKTHHAVTLDVISFEQRGCLSPHHIFIGGRDEGTAIAFAARLATCLKFITNGPMPGPRKIGLSDLAAIRRIREQARWRQIGGAPVKLWEGPIPGWTVIYDRDALFCPSPGYRTVLVSPFRDAKDLEWRMSPIAGRLEAAAFKSDAAGDPAYNSDSLRSVLKRSGATYICEPGRMQSPPLNWPHGGGTFLRSLCES